MQFGSKQFRSVYFKTIQLGKVQNISAQLT